MQVRGQVPVRPRRPRVAQPRATPQVQDRAVPHLPHRGLLPLRPSVPLHPQRRGGARQRHHEESSSPALLAAGPRLQRRHSLSAEQPGQRLSPAVLHLQHSLLLRVSSPRAARVPGQSEPVPVAASAPRLPRREAPRLQQNQSQPRDGPGVPVRRRAHRIDRPIYTQYDFSCILISSTSLLI